MPKFCPHIMDECLEAKCVHWLPFPMREAAEPLNAPGVIKHDCAINWTARFQFQSCQQLFGVQSATESRGNATIERQDALLRAVLNPKQVDRLPEDRGYVLIEKGNGDARSED